MKKMLLVLLFSFLAMPLSAKTADNLDIAIQSVFTKSMITACQTQLAPCTILSLATGTPNIGQVTIENRSPNTTAYNIAAIIPSSFGNDLTQTTSGCSTVAPNGTCVIQLTVSPAATSHSLTEVEIKGTNTRSIYLYVEIAA